MGRALQGVMLYPARCIVYDESSVQGRLQGRKLVRGQGVVSTLS